MASEINEAPLHSLEVGSKDQPCIIEIDDSSSPSIPKQNSFIKMMNSANSAAANKQPVSPKKNKEAVSPKKIKNDKKISKSENLVKSGSRFAECPKCQRSILIL
jgi:hypothetical protein